MAYQELVVAKAVKKGLVDSDSRGAIWYNVEYAQGIKFANDGKTILLAENVQAVGVNGNATWDSTPATVNTVTDTNKYSAKLQKFATGADCSTHLQFTPIKKITFGDFCDNIIAAIEYSFWHHSAAGVANYVQWEFRFEDPVSARMGDGHGWLEITVLPLQGHNGIGAYAQVTLTGANLCGYGGVTPDGTSVWGWPPGVALTAITDLKGVVDADWDNKEPGTGAATADYPLTRIRFELWEDAPARISYIDDAVKIDGDTYLIEPGMAGAELGTAIPGITLTFVAYRDIYGRLETLTPVVWATQALIVGPLLPALFNDSSGFAKFKPSGIGSAVGDIRYSAISVSNPS